ncbi:MAG: ABC transporter ATP-binding protein [Gemmatimonadetes bacterium]|jgi:ATP-binding cassette, subfamily B, bacterial|nr:ABC transporter ATP-binding protein [Gemmatimonadota bacterium]MBT6145710.1 ABC transporter ATP-binding protein [Gemmatimonadota bacterium]MBT7859473.1 ABC transporter ATP-binding protein [Gemmatimonadota bacterium]
MTDTDEHEPDIPPELQRQLDPLLYKDEALCLAVETDVQLDGHYGTSWLLATPRRLLLLTPSGSGPDLLELPLTDICTAELIDHQGSGALRVRTDERGLIMARFTRTRMPAFIDVPSQLERLIQQQRDVPEDESIAGEDPGWGRGGNRRCEACGRVIPRRFGLCPACLETRKLLFRLLGYAKPYRGLAAISLTLMLLATWVGLTPPLLMRSLFDDVLVPNAQGTWLTPWLQGMERPDALKALALILLGIYVSSNVMNAIRRYVLAWLGQHVTLDLRNQVYRHLHTLSLSFYNERETGRVMASITQDVGRLQDFISDGLQEIIRDVLTILIICTILFYLNPTLALLVLLPTPLLVFTTLRFGGRLHLVYRGLWRRWAGISALLADTIPGVRVVKAFSQEKREVGKFESRSGELLIGELRAARLQSLFSPIMSFITRIGTLIVWLVGGAKVLDESLTLGEFTAFTGYMWQFYGPVESLCRLNHRFQRAATSAERVFETLDAPADIVDKPQATRMPRIEGRVEFRDVTFSYEEGKPVLEHLDLTIEPGEMIGLAGHSGAGKSTFINLIGRFYDVDSGALFIDGHCVRDVELKSLRDQIGVVLQDPFLFNGSIADNIAYGKPEAGPDEVVAAARAAHAHEFVVELPDGYDTLVGERGARLSGGERQRISIARAILRNPRILILDEATSNVDTETEQKIQQALERLILGRTTFAIAHRLSTLRHANRLLILEKGRIAEIGTHDELIEADGIYARLCRIQTDAIQRRVW